MPQAFFAAAFPGQDMGPLQLALQTVPPMLRRVCVEVYYWYAVREGLGTQVARGTSAPAMDRDALPPFHLFLVLVTALAAASAGASPQPTSPSELAEPGAFVPLREVFRGLGSLDTWDSAQCVPEASVFQEVRAWSEVSTEFTGRGEAFVSVCECVSKWEATHVGGGRWEVGGGRWEVGGGRYMYRPVAAPPACICFSRGRVPPPNTISQERRAIRSALAGMLGVLEGSVPCPHCPSDDGLILPLPSCHLVSSRLEHRWSVARCGSSLMWPSCCPAAPSGLHVSVPLGSLFLPPPSLVLLLVEAAGFPFQNGWLSLMLLPPQETFCFLHKNPCPPQVPNAGPVLLLLLRLLWNRPG